MQKIVKYKKTKNNLKDLYVQNETISNLAVQLTKEKMNEVVAKVNSDQQKMKIST